MSNIAKALTLALALPFAQTATAQTAATPAPAAAPAATPAPAAAAGADAMSMGKDVVGSTYVKDTFDDWAQRCVHSSDDNDPCEAYQLLKDDKNNPVSEFSVFPLVDGGQAVAGATVLTPLETLLTANVTLQIDGSPARRYPFNWCSRAGCFSRLGFNGGDIALMKKGVSATLSIVPLASPNKPIALKISLKGFTAAYAAVEKNNTEVRKARAAAAAAKKKN